MRREQARQKHGDLNGVIFAIMPFIFFARRDMLLRQH